MLTLGSGQVTQARQTDRTNIILTYCGQGSAIFYNLSSILVWVVYYNESTAEATNT